MSEGSAFGSWLKQRRKAFDMTQEYLARQVGCSLQTVVKIEAGERKPSKQVAERLAECLSVPADERSAFVQFARTDLLNGQSPVSLLVQADDRAPWRMLRHRPHVRYANNLPAPLNPFIGREKQVVTTANLLRRQGVRLVSMVGPPGIGKTRLGLQVASELLNEFDGGVYFVALASVQDHRLVLSAICQTLGVREASRKPLLPTLKNYLHDRRMLLVLDNFEQVVSAGPLVTDLLISAPGLKILVTSRTALHLYGEYELRVPPMALPERKRHIVGDAERLAEYEAVELFIERARAVKPDFAINETNAQIISELCHQLDGLPLAIELAAARVKFLSPQVVLDRLTSAEGKMKLLAGGPANLPARQRTMRAAIAWSYELLEPDEQQVFRQMSVFVGGCTLEAAIRILDFGFWISDPSEELEAESVQNPKSKIQNYIDSLVDKSLLRQEEQGDGLRFKMLETIRDYGLERLVEGGETENIPRRFADFFLDLAERADAQMRGPYEAAWLDKLEAEYDNLRATLRWLEGTGVGTQWSEPKPPNEVKGKSRAPLMETALRMAAALGWFWFRRGYLSEGRRHLVEILSRTKPLGSEQPEMRAKALIAAARLADHQGDNAMARSLYEDGLAASQALDIAEGVGHALCGLGFTTFREGNGSQARVLYEQGLETFRKLVPGRERTLGMAIALRGLGDVALREGDYILAQSLYTESLALFQEIGDKYSVATLLNGLGNVALDTGDYASARSLYEDALAILQEMRYNFGVAISLLSLGEVARCQGDYQAACTLHERSLEIWRELGDKWNTAMAMHNLGHAVHHQGDFKRAGALFVESLMLFLDVSAKAGIPMCLAGLAGVAGSIQQAERSARLFGATEALLDAAGAPLQGADLADYELNITATRNMLDETAFAAAWSDGHSMTAEQAVSYALEES